MRILVAEDNQFYRVALESTLREWGYETIALADRLGLPQAQKETLRRGALLHDIGKIALPDDILNKAGPLTPEEFEAVKQHPLQGVRMVEALDSVRDVIPLIRSHHERCDGRG